MEHITEIKVTVHMEINKQSIHEEFTDFQSSIDYMKDLMHQYGFGELPVATTHLFTDKSSWCIIPAEEADRLEAAGFIKRTGLSLNLAD